MASEFVERLGRHRMFPGQTLHRQHCDDSRFQQGIFVVRAARFLPPQTEMAACCIQHRPSLRPASEKGLPFLRGPVWERYVGAFLCPCSFFSSTSVTKAICHLAAANANRLLCRNIQSDLLSNVKCSVLFSIDLQTTFSRTLAHIRFHTESGIVSWMGHHQLYRQWQDSVADSEAGGRGSSDLDRWR